MKTACISLEGVLAPCLWEEISRVATIPGLSRSDASLSADPASIMHSRIALLRQHRIGIDDLHFIASMFCPLSGAPAFVRALRKEYRVVVFSDLPAELAAHFTTALDEVELICPDLSISKEGYLEDGAFSPAFREEAVMAMSRPDQHTLAIGHLPAHLPMLRKADAGILYRPSPATCAAAPDLEVAGTFRDIMKRHLAFRMDDFFVTEVNRDSGNSDSHNTPSRLLS